MCSIPNTAAGQKRACCYTFPPSSAQGFLCCLANKEPISSYYRINSASPCKHSAYLFFAAEIVDVILANKDLPRDKLQELVLAASRRHQVALRTETTANFLANFNNFVQRMLLILFGKSIVSRKTKTKKKEFDST
jgi:hypothetical protein